MANEVHHHRHLGNGDKTGMKDEPVNVAWLDHSVTIQEQGRMLGYEPTHVAAEDAVHYGRKPIRADQFSAKGDKVRMYAVPLPHLDLEPEREPGTLSRNKRTKPVRRRERILQLRDYLPPFHDKLMHSSQK
jgi:hypothetical protein